MNSVPDLSAVFDRTAFLLLVGYVLVLPYEQLLRTTTNLFVLAIAATTTLSVLFGERDVSVSRYQFFSIGAFAGVLAWVGLAALIGPAPFASLLASRVYVLYFIVTTAFVVVVDSLSSVSAISVTSSERRSPVPRTTLECTRGGSNAGRAPLPRAHGPTGAVNARLGPGEAA